jgi:hypothetical protein
MTQSFHVDPVRLSQKETRSILARLVAPFADRWSLGKALLWVLLMAVAAILVWVCLVLWSLNQPRTRTALPDDVSQIRLVYVGSAGPNHQRIVSQAVLLSDDSAKAFATLANRALTHKNWYQVIRGASTCELQFAFLDSNSSVRRTLSVAQEDGGLVVYDNKWRQLLQGMESVRFLEIVPQSRLSAMRSEACGK